MRKIRFYNNGFLNKEAFTLMGVSVKADNTKIGQFGTGMKYAIAGIIRDGGNITIRTGGTTYTFGSVEKDIRGKKFDIITCNGEELSYSTEYGKHWKSWQWFRELQSNALDEGGDSTDQPVHLSDTVITVNHAGIAECWAEREKYFLPQNANVIENIKGNQILHCSKGHVYCKGVYVGESKFPLSVNFADLPLTEDRTAQNVDQYIAKVLVQSENQRVIDASLRSDYPNYFAVWSGEPVSERWLDTVEDSIRNCRDLPSGTANIHKRIRGEVQREDRALETFVMAVPPPSQ